MRCYNCEKTSYPIEKKKKSHKKYSQLWDHNLSQSRSGRYKVAIARHFLNYMI